MLGKDLARDAEEKLNGNNYNNIELGFAGDKEEKLNYYNNNNNNKIVGYAEDYGEKKSNETNYFFEIMDIAGDSCIEKLNDNNCIETTNLIRDVEDQNKLINGNNYRQTIDLVGEAREELESNDHNHAKEEVSGRERLKRHRSEMAGRVWIPETWGQESFLQDWKDCSVIDRSLVPSGLLSARRALVEECQRANSGRMRIGKSCLVCTCYNM